MEAGKIRGGGGKWIRYNCCTSPVLGVETAKNSCDADTAGFGLGLAVVHDRGVEFAGDVATGVVNPCFGAFSPMYVTVKGRGLVCSSPLRGWCMTSQGVGGKFTGIEREGVRGSVPYGHLASKPFT